MIYKKFTYGGTSSVHSNYMSVIEMFTLLSTSSQKRPFCCYFTRHWDITETEFDPLTSIFTSNCSTICSTRSDPNNIGSSMRNLRSQCCSLFTIDKRQLGNLSLQKRQLWDWAYRNISLLQLAFEI